MQSFKLSCLVVGLFGVFSLSAAASPVFVNGLSIAASTGDQLGTSVNNGRLGFFSDIYYDNAKNEWWGLSDRGPGGGTISYDTRVQRFTLDVNPTTGAINNFKVAETVVFKNGTAALNGLAPAPSNVLGNAFDPEGFVINPTNGHMLVSDEYGPSVYEFDRQGNQIRQFATPENLIPRNAATNEPNFAGDANNTAGKRTNRGFEGLAISPDGKYSFAMLQSATLDEGAGNGVYNRIVKFDNATGEAVAQYAYKMEGSSQGRGISALVALNDQEFLVLERNNRGVGVDSDLANPNKKVFSINLAGATDVTNIDLDAAGATFVAANKNTSALIDLAANKPFLGGRSPEKWEGLAIGPQLADGTYMILAGTDNDYSITQNGTAVQYEIYFNAATGERISCEIGTFNLCTSIPAGGGLGTVLYTGSTAGFEAIPGILYAYKTEAGDLPTLVSAVPLPGALPLMLSGMALLGMAARKTKAGD